MKRLLVLCVVTLQMASAADAFDRRNAAQSGDHGGQSAVWRHGTHHEWGVASRYRCVVPDVCPSGFTRLRNRSGWGGADITRTATGPVSRRRIVLANPAPLDIDELGAHIRNATDAQRESSPARKSPRSDHVLTAV
jgi:hypothetical protein